MYLSDFMLVESEIPNMWWPSGLGEQKLGNPKPILRLSSGWCFNQIWYHSKKQQQTRFWDGCFKKGKKHRNFLLTLGDIWISWHQPCPIKSMYVMFTYIKLPWIRHGYCNFAGNHHDQSSFGTPTDTQSTRQCGVLNDFYFLRNKMGLKKTAGKNPRGSMYGISTYIYSICTVNVGKYTSPMDPLGMEQHQMGKCWKTIGTNILWNVWKIVL